MKKLAITVLAALALQSCTERIDLELNDSDSQRLVVEGWVTDELKQQEVKLTLTTSYFFEEAAPNATGATVTITDGSTTWALDEEEPGIYRTETFAGEHMETYTLNIDYDGEQYEGSSTLRPTAPIDSIAAIVFDPEEEFGFPLPEYYSIRLWGLELPGEGDAYIWKMSVNNEPVRDTLTELSIAVDDFFDGLYLADVEIHSLSIEDEEAVPGDTVLIEQWNIGREGYDVFFGIANETAFNGGLFDAPPANVETNMSNGALGYFGAAGVSTKEAIVPE